MESIKKKFKESLTNELLRLDWDYDGLKENDCFHFQSEWNQTLMIKINQISANIYQKTLSGGSNLIIISPQMISIIKNLYYFQTEYQKCVGYSKIGTISHYTVITSTKIVEFDEIIVAKVEWINNNFKNSKIDNNFGIIKIKNTPIKTPN